MRQETIGDATLYCAEWYDTCAALPDASVDAILTDLPYGTTACKWDTIIPFAPMWAAVKRVLKPRGVFVTTASQPFTSALVMSNTAWFKYCWVWDKVNKNTNYGNANHMPLRRHEDIAVFSANGHAYNPQMADGKPYAANSMGARPGVYANGGLHPHKTVNLGTRFPVSVLTIKADNKLELGLHPTQKPVALYAYLVRTYTNEGDTVLDFCMGSGTTAVACAQTGRRFIGGDNNKAYFDIACKRIEAAQQQLRLGV